MAFTFIHTADWQLGKSFGQFPAEAASALRLARQAVIERIADVAREQKTTHVLVAGDVWDSAIPSNSTLRQPLAIMGEAPDINWWLLPGNHDPDGPDGLWDRINVVKPGNVHTLREAVPVEIETGVFLLPAPWARIQHGQDLTVWMDAADTPKGALRIGLAHGSVQGFGTEGDTDREIIPPTRAETAKLDYLALGDWHARREINGLIHYPGTPEPDRHKSGARGQVLAVTLERGARPQIEAIATAQYDWPVLSTTLQPETVDVSLEILRQALTSGQPLRRTHARLDVSGDMTVSEWAVFEAFLEEMKGEMASLDIRGEGEVRLVVVPEDIEALDAQGSVREAAEVLVARSENPDLSRDDRQIASEALRLLFRYAGEST
jgi:DNA repair exonuclease SbcCD nuclease subunit